MKREVKIGDRRVGDGHPAVIVAEIGINHEGSLEKAVRMVDDAHAAGCECVKFQCHVIDDEMIPNSVVPGNATESIWDIMSRCALRAEAARAPPPPPRRAAEGAMSAVNPPGATPPGAVPPGAMPPPGPGQPPPAGMLAAQHAGVELAQRGIGLGQRHHREASPGPA